METNYRMGIDLGSTTAKMAIIDTNGQIVFSAYRRHHTEARASLITILRDAITQIGDVPVSVLLTGSAGMGVSESFELPFVQEVIAAAEVVQQRCPQVRTLIDIGGEDAKLIFFQPGCPPDIRMNGSCAGGTGAFIDQMATLLNLPVTEINALAEKSHTIYPIASRCGVFAKTDVQNLLSRDIPHADIVASVLNAVVYQTLATLARGRNPEAQLVFCGGPLTFLPELRHCFMQALGLTPADVYTLEHSELLPALGAALADKADRRVITLNDLIKTLETPRVHADASQTRLTALFQNDEERQTWVQNLGRGKVQRTTLEKVQGQACFLGIDSGSTTTKIVLIDQLGRLLFSRYTHNKGDALNTARKGLEELKQAFNGVAQPPYIARAAVTGYGEDLIRAAFGCDEGLVETIAHFRAAQAFDPKVSFILDIGGQDMKAIFVENGHIRSIEINEACSSGCGTFIESFAASLGQPVANFAQKALDSQSPCDLGTRCTVFMNSKVKQALREGAGVEDISAGLAYSVIKNAMHKVLKITNPDIFGDHILVQGGTFRNPAVHKALENITGRPALCPDISELMGAYGAALCVRDSWQRLDQPASRFSGLNNLEAAEHYEKKYVYCQGCENRCTITRLTFTNKNVFYTGNRCEKIFSNTGNQHKRGASLPELKYNLLFDRPTEPAGTPRATIGIPRVLNFFENYPFWNALFIETGFRVKLSRPSSVSLYEKGAHTIMSENICFPAKLVHGHIYDLIEAKVDRIFYPLVTFESPEFNDADSCYNCPIVGGYPELLQSTIDPQRKHGIPLDKPAINFRNLDLLRRACQEYFIGLGVDKRDFQKAFEKAVAAQRQYKQEVRQAGEELLNKARAAGRPMALLLGRPYHIDPQIHHKTPDILAGFGVDVLTEDAIPLPTQTQLKNKHVATLWEYPNRYYHAARWAAQQQDMEVVQLNSFGCGPDAVAVDEVRRTLGEYGRGHTVIRIDEIESTGSTRLRLRSMVESMQQRVPTQPTFTPRRTTPLYQKADRKRLILAPEFAHFCTQPIVRPIQDMGYNLKILPPADRKSVEVGLKYVNNEICYPATVVIGDVIKALQSGEYNPDDVAVAISQTGGQCRDTCYLFMLKQALVSSGFENVPVVSVATNFNPLNEQPGFTPNYAAFAYKMLMGLVLSDAITSMYHATAVREIVPGQALAVADRYLECLKDKSFKLTPGNILATVRQAVADFNQIETRPGDLPGVAVVGEIYVKLNDFGNNNVVQWLMNQGIEVYVPPLMEYFTSNFVNWNVDLQANITRMDWLWAISRLVEGPVNSFLDQADKILHNFQYYRPAHNIWRIADMAKQTLALTNHYGEGWLIPGEVGTFFESGVKNVLCLQPFGCIANHVVAKGIQNTLKENFPGLNLLFLDCDAGVSEVNFFNRLHFFVHHAREWANA
jgi:predicted CoA-substrate-specific enzyme activase